ncbi:nucleolar protein 3 [Orycteropus afer afer]|uniref:Nucleolar protein 3 n=1 Tax=Orycteropus afer afer TaxID=1230840 RepID=A0AC54Z9Q2_ORYAF|nr:nucleolar protein 3 [Orycteropus afer afer]
MGNAQERPSETIDRERKRLVETLQADSGLLLDALLARGVLNAAEYEALDALPDAERRMRRLLLLVQSKGEAACNELLHCAQRTARAPDPAWDWQHVGPGYRDRSYDPPCPGHWTPETSGSGTTCPGLPRPSDWDGAGGPEGSEAVQSGIPEEPKQELEAEASEEAEPEPEPQMDPESEPEQEPEPEPEPEPDCEAADESEGIPEDQSVDQQLPAQTERDVGSCLGWVDATKTPCGSVPLEVNKRWRSSACSCPQ